MKRILFLLNIIELEAVMWIAGLIYLMAINPYHVRDFTFCPFHNLGIKFCPGCGLGRSVSFLFHGDLFSSFSTHPLGILTVFIIAERIIELTFRSYKKYLTTKEVLYG